MTLPPTGAFPRLPLSSGADVDPHHSPDPSAEVQQLLGDSVPTLGVATTGASSTPPPSI